MNAVIVSALKRIKTYLRNSMTQSRLNHCMLLHIHKEKTENLDLCDIAKDLFNVMTGGLITLDIFRCLLLLAIIITVINLLFLPPPPPNKFSIPTPLRMDKKTYVPATGIIPCS